MGPHVVDLVAFSEAVFVEFGLYHFLVVLLVAFEVQVNNLLLLSVSWDDVEDLEKIVSIFVKFNFVSICQ